VRIHSARGFGLSRGVSAGRAMRGGPSLEIHDDDDEL
jgi:hypothetical protein